MQRDCNYPSNFLSSTDLYFNENRPNLLTSLDELALIHTPQVTFSFLLDLFHRLATEHLLVVPILKYKFFAKKRKWSGLLSI